MAPAPGTTLVRASLLLALTVGLTAVGAAPALAGEKGHERAHEVADENGIENGHDKHEVVAGGDHTDPAPAGVDVTSFVPTAQVLSAVGLDPAHPVFGTAAGRPAGTPASSALAQHVDTWCGGTGDDGARVQALYVVEQGGPDRYDAVRPALAQVLADIDDTFALSARETGGGRRVRWVTTAPTADGCSPVVPRVVVPAGALASFTASRQALTGLGWNLGTRKYLVFAEATTMCGIADIAGDASPAATNLSNGGTAMFARVDSACWQGQPATHELTHTLGAVQNGAPHSTGYGHCNDGLEVMCYADGGPAQAQLSVCAADHADLLDCGGDDYFSTAETPAGSWLGSHWNTAASSFLAVVPVLPVAPTVTVTAPASAVTGELVTLSATSPDALTYAWSSAFDACSPVDGTSTDTARFRCPAGSAGARDFVLQADRADGQSVSRRVTVTVTEAAAPTAGAQVTTANPVGGEPVTLTATAAGVAPLTYDWTTSPSNTGAQRSVDGLGYGGCTYTGTTSAVLTVLCPADGVARSLSVTLLVHQADGRSTAAAVSFAVAAASPPAPPPVARITGPASVEAGRPAVYRLSSDRAGAALALVTNRRDCTVTARTADAVTVVCAFAARGTLTVTATARDTGTGAQSSATLVTRLLVPSTTLTATVRVGRPDLVIGTLARYGGRVAGQTVVLQARRAGTTTWTNVTTLRTSSAGQVVAKVQPRRATSYRWVFAGTTAWRPSTSGIVSVRY